MTDTATSQFAGHTPGVWRIEHGGGHAPNRIVGAEAIHTNGLLRDSSGISSASYSDVICENMGDLSLPGPAANAELLVAAPRLLAERDRLRVLLKWAVLRIELAKRDEAPGCHILSAWAVDARAALAETEADK